MALLSACQKPFPTITVSGNGHAVIVRAARYAFTGGPMHTPIKDVGEAPHITVRAGTQLIVGRARSRC